MGNIIWATLARLLLLAALVVGASPRPAAGQELTLAWRQLAFDGVAVHALALGDEGRVLYLSTDLGLQVSEDGGESWLYAGLGLEAVEAPRVEALAVSPRDARTAFAGTLAGSYAGIYVTRDLGRTWWKAWSGLRGEGIRTIAVAEVDPQPVLAVTAQRERADEYLVLSPDGGRLWMPVLLNSGAHPLAILDVTFRPGSGNVAYVASSDGLLLSGDGGRAWQLSRRGVTGASIAAIPGRAGWLFASGGRELLLSRDGGRSWQPLRGPRVGSCEAFSPDGIAASGGETPVLLATTTSLCAQVPGRVYAAALTGNRVQDWDAVDAGLPLERSPRVIAGPWQAPKAYALTNSGLWVADVPAGRTVDSRAGEERAQELEHGTKDAAAVPNSPAEGATAVAGTDGKAAPPGGEAFPVLAFGAVAVLVVWWLAATRHSREQGES